MTWKNQNKTFKKSKWKMNAVLLDSSISSAMVANDNRIVKNAMYALKVFNQCKCEKKNRNEKKT